MRLMVGKRVSWGSSWDLGSRGACDGHSSVPLLQASLLVAFLTPALFSLPLPSSPEAGPPLAPARVSFQLRLPHDCLKAVIGLHLTLGVLLFPGCSWQGRGWNRESAKTPGSAGKLGHFDQNAGPWREDRGGGT